MDISFVEKDFSEANMWGAWSYSISSNVRGEKKKNGWSRMVSE